MMLQKDNPGTVQTRYFRGLGIDEMWQRTDVGGAGTNRSYFADGLGSVVALADTNRAIQTEYDYDPFGTTTGSGSGNKNPFKFTGREDDGTGLYFYRARYYHPALGRFVSEDPIEYLGGDINLYGYVGGNTLNRIDPTGEFVTEAATAAGAAAATAGGISVGAGVAIGAGVATISGLLGYGFGSIPLIKDPLSDLLAPIFEDSKGGRQKGENYISLAAKIEAQKTGRNVCDVLADWLAKAKCEGNTQLLKDIEEAQKFLGCRNITKRKSS
jgi:RHS repeat-associated protein